MNGLEKKSGIADTLQGWLENSGAGFVGLRADKIAPWPRTVLLCRGKTEKWGVKPRPSQDCIRMHTP